MRMNNQVYDFMCDLYREILGELETLGLKSAQYAAYVNICGDILYLCNVGTYVQTYKAITRYYRRGLFSRGDFEDVLNRINVGVTVCYAGRRA